MDYLNGWDENRFTMILLIFMQLRFHAIGFFECSRYRMNIPKLYHETGIRKLLQKLYSPILQGKQCPTINLAYL